jgi:hypothetical protein
MPRDPRKAAGISSRRLEQQAVERMKIGEGHNSNHDVAGGRNQCPPTQLGSIPGQKRRCEKTQQSESQYRTGMEHLEPSIVGRSGGECSDGFRRRCAPDWIDDHSLEKIAADADRQHHSSDPQTYAGRPCSHGAADVSTARASPRVRENRAGPDSLAWAYGQRFRKFAPHCPPRYPSAFPVPSTPSGLK